MKGFIAKKRWIILVLLLHAVFLSLYLFNSSLERNRIRNVVLISIDTCRADRLGCYGFELNTTPNIDALSQEGTLFENAISPVPITLPAHVTMLTGTIPPYHGVHDNMAYKLESSGVTLAEILKENGFTTGAVIGCYMLNSRFGLSQGFDSYNERFEEERLNTGRVNERYASEVSRFADEWLEENSDDDFFLFLHYYDPHRDYLPPEPFASKFFGKPYAGEIAYVDYSIGQVIKKLKKLGLYDSTLIIVTADHGEMLGEHGELTHAYFIYQSAIRVPLIFKLPGQTESRRIEPAVGLVDIVPTICGLLGIDAPEQLDGVDLSDCLRKNKPLQADRFLYCGSLYPTKYKGNSLLGLVSRRFKYIQTTRPELYDLVKDPHERNNLVEERPGLAKSLKAQLAQLLEESVRDQNSDTNIYLDAQSRARLESLGYVAGQLSEDFGFNQTSEDPKDLITLHKSFIICYGLIAQNRLKAAKIIAENFVKRKPDSHVGYGLLARIAVYSGDNPGACIYFSKVLEYDPGNTDAMNNAAWFLATLEGTELYSPEKAIAMAQKACELTDYKQPELMDTLGVAYAALGNFKKAIELAEEALLLADAYGQKARVVEIQEHLKSYRVNQPYRGPSLILENQ